VAINSMPYNKSPINSLPMPKLKVLKFQGPSDCPTNTLESAVEDLHAVKVLKHGIIGK
jgi:hypothetical protein